MSGSPVAVDSPVRWGLGDFLWIWLAQIAGALVAELAVFAASGVEDEVSTGAFFGVVVPAQALAGLAAAWVLIERKGRHGLVGDLGVHFRRSDWTAFPMGLGLQVIFGMLLQPFLRLLDTDEPAQELIETIDQTEGVLVWLAIVIGVVFLQPVLEEVLFRGVLLRALLRRTGPTPAVLWSGALFGAVHVFGTGLGLSAIPTIVGLSGLGFLLSIQALRHGSLGRPILTHMGFNLLTVVALMVS